MLLLSFDLFESLQDSELIIGSHRSLRIVSLRLCLVVRPSWVDTGRVDIGTSRLCLGFFGTSYFVFHGLFTLTHHACEYISHCGRQNVVGSRMMCTECTEDITRKQVSGIRGTTTDNRTVYYARYVYLYIYIYILVWTWRDPGSGENQGDSKAEREKAVRTCGIKGQLMRVVDDSLRWWELNSDFWKGEGTLEGEGFLEGGGTLYGRGT